MLVTDGRLSQPISIEESLEKAEYLEDDIIDGRLSLVRDIVDNSLGGSGSGDGEASNCSGSNDSGGGASGGNGDGDFSLVKLRISDHSSNNSVSII